MEIHAVKAVRQSQPFSKITKAASQFIAKFIKMQISDKIKNPPRDNQCADLKVPGH